MMEVLRKRRVYVLSVHIYFIYMWRKNHGFLGSKRDEKREGRENIENLREEELGKLDIASKRWLPKKEKWDEIGKGKKE